MRVILLYHSVGTDAPQSIPVAVFARQLEDLMRRKFQVVRLRDLPTKLASAPPDANIACVTFDDGYRDNYECAVPVLEEFGVKATFFVATGFLGKTFPTFSGEFPMMSAAQVRELGGLGHEIGAHTVTHPKLTTVPLATARAEIEISRRFLEDLLSSAVVSFAYPKGEYNAGVEALLPPLGFTVAATTRAALVNEEPDWLALPRVWIGRQLSRGAFAARTSPALDWYTWLWRWS
ncbi:MAG: polysaccharide deacetylase family protein [Candidatus Binatia bacterium]